MLDAEVKALLDGMAAQETPKISEQTPEMARAMYVAMAGMLDPTDLPIGKVEDSTFPGPAGDVPIRVYTPTGASGTLPLLLFFHGGGFVIGDLDTHDALCRSFAEGAKAKVIAVHYRLAPEAPFPAAVEDCAAALDWVVANAGSLGIDAARIAVAGDSAGGNLSAVVSQIARDKGGPALKLQLLIYPATDARRGYPSYEENGVGYFLENETIDWFFSHYVPGGTEATDPRFSPLLASSHEGLAPAYIITAGYDPLRDEGKAYAEKLEAAGVPVTYVNYEGTIHGFFNMQAVSGLSREAVAAATAALAKALA